MFKTIVFFQWMLDCQLHTVYLKTHKQTHTSSFITFPLRMPDVFIRNWWLCHNGTCAITVKTCSAVIIQPLPNKKLNVVTDEISHSQERYSWTVPAIQCYCSFLHACGMRVILNLLKVKLLKKTLWLSDLKERKYLLTQWNRVKTAPYNGLE